MRKVNSIRAKAPTQKELHQMSVDFIMMAQKYMQKHPDFVSALMVDHKNNILDFRLFKPDENYEQAEGC